MGEQSRIVARERFDERRVVEIVLDTYRDVARGKGVELPGLTDSSQLLMESGTEPRHSADPLLRLSHSSVVTPVAGRLATARQVRT